MTNTTRLPAPSLLRRIAAIIYDTFLAVAVLLTTTALMIGLRVGVEGSESLQQGQPAISGVWELPTFLLNLLALATFFAYFWVKSGQTLGMQTWRIRIQDSNSGKPISWQQAYLRFGGALLSTACAGLGYLWVILDKKHEAWHDKLSHSELVVVPKHNQK